MYIVTSLWETALRVFIREHYFTHWDTFLGPTMSQKHSFTATKMLPVGTGIFFFSFTSELLSYAVGISFC